ncbi:MAG: hypothetical protein U1F43_23200 [Myxococcota bacterium]
MRVSDRDADYLCDEVETNITHTDPDDPDTDDDACRTAKRVSGGDDPFAYDDGFDTNLLDADTDDDGISDGDEVHGTGPLEAVGLLDPLDPDSDDDNVADGVEVGVDAGAGRCQRRGRRAVQGHRPHRVDPDADPETKTDPLDDDTDDDGLKDGTEDANGNGSWDGTIGTTGTHADARARPIRVTPTPTATTSRTARSRA